ncbi:MAG: SDR family oxidoreductase [candidate division Zixibacteria bacterium]|nr:SDR family oxidoreductase [candidate division Zixibacteria bacterium]
MVLSGRIALITGASKGIGRAIALGFAKEGADLALCGRNMDQVRETAQEAERLGRRVLALRADVSSETDVRRMVDETLRIYGRIDILHNNAGVLYAHTLVDHPRDLWNETMAINVNGVLYGCQAVLPHMARQGYGRVINMSSILSALCVPSYGAYSVSKAAVNAITKTLAGEFRGKNILINGQHPGNIRTDMNPRGTHPVDLAVPTAVYLASLPEDGPTGKFFFNMKEMPEIY